MADEEREQDSPYFSDDEEEESVFKDMDESESDSDSDDGIDPKDKSARGNYKRFAKALDSKKLRKKIEEEEDNMVYLEDMYDFPEDPEDWREIDLGEHWADAPFGSRKSGWDPNWVDREDVFALESERYITGREPTIAPYYVPYRRAYPIVPGRKHPDLKTPKNVIEQLDMIEEFLVWHSFIFEDESSYEGTVWDDLAHGKGVYVAEDGLVRYEGEWVRNAPEGHGVLEVDIPTYEPVPGSKLDTKVRAKGVKFKRDFMTPEDREWLEMDIEDSIHFADGEREIPFYENLEWIRQFGQKPEKGRYRYAGQWKHGRMHGCGVFELNERVRYGRFYFGEFLEEEHGCDVNASGLHSGIADVAAAKARMFVNKPDGMVREMFGPYSDPQHPYLYEEEDVWMAPGFINQFYEVPDVWETYVEDVDEERQMWINSFYKAPLRLPMPPELEYWWETEEAPEFVLLNKEPEPDPEDPSKLIYTEDPLILHRPSGRLIDYVEDDEHGIRLFWHPTVEEAEDDEDDEYLDPNKVEFLPLGFDEFFGHKRAVKKPGILQRMVTQVERKCKPVFGKLEKWSEEKKKNTEMKLKLIETELDLVEAESDLKKSIKDMDKELKRLEKEEEKKIEKGMEEEDYTVKSDEPTEKYDQISRDKDEIEKEDEGKDEEEEEKEEEEEDDDEDENAPPSFGSVTDDQSSIKNDQNGEADGKSSPFATTSLSFASCGLASLVPSQLQQSFAAWKESKVQKRTSLPSWVSTYQQTAASSVRFTRAVDRGLTLRAVRQTHHQGNQYITKSRFRNNSKLRSIAHLQRNTVEQSLRNSIWPHMDSGEGLNILSLHTPPWYVV